MIPQALHDLSDLMTYIQRMTDDYDRGVFGGWHDFAKQVRQWYTPQRLQQIDDIVMGWKKMSTFANEQTLIHLTAILISVLKLLEYQDLSPVQQNLAMWIVLYHDVDKEPTHHKRDLIHGFRSASVCGQGLVRHGLIRDVDQDALTQWARLTYDAICYDKTINDNTQDNSKLEQIMSGIDTVFGGRDTSAGLIICGVLFHMSLNVVDDWPQAAPLTNDQIRAYISPIVFPLLRVMMRTDNMAWALFDPERHAPEREQTHREFDRVKALIAV